MRFVLLLLLPALLLAEICPYCKAAKLKSTVTPGAKWVRDPYYDEKGKLHQEKPTRDFSCSLGHQYRRLPDGNYEPQGDAAIQVHRAVLRTPKRQITCTIDAAKFQALKEARARCKVGNCAAAPAVSMEFAMDQLLEAIVCR